MLDKEHPTHLVVSDDADARAQYLGLLSDHQSAISALTESVSAREWFAQSNVVHAVASMRRALAEFEGTASRVSEFLDQNIGQI